MCLDALNMLGYLIRYGMYFPLLSCYSLSFHVYFLCILLVLSIYHVHVGSTTYREGEIIIQGILVRQRSLSVGADTSCCLWPSYFVRLITVKSIRKFSLIGSFSPNRGKLPQSGEFLQFL